MSFAVEFQEVSRHYGKVRAVDGVSLAIAEGEFFSMLGPSGSGKTTCLRLIAGFEQPTSGSIRIHGVEAAGVPPFALLLASQLGMPVQGFFESIISKVQPPSFFNSF